MDPHQIAKELVDRFLDRGWIRGDGDGWVGGSAARARGEGQWIDEAMLQEIERALREMRNRTINEFLQDNV